jgi:hypothetical protein
MKEDNMTEDGWIKHDGGPCPVDGDVMVKVRIDGCEHGWRSAKWWDDENPEESNWSCEDSSRIIAYKIVERP